MKKFLSFLTAILLCASATLASACQFNDSSSSSYLEDSSSSPISSVEESSSSLPEIIEPCEEHTFGEWETIQEYACGAVKQERACVYCNEKQTETLNFFAHTFDENTLCSTCGHQEFIESEEYITVDDQSNGNFTHIFYTWWSQDKSYALVLLTTNVGTILSTFIFGYLGTPINAIIPTNIYDITIASIGGGYGWGSLAMPFENCETLESVRIPKNMDIYVRGVGHPFRGCSNLKYLYFPKNTSIATPNFQLIALNAEIIYYD